MIRINLAPVETRRRGPSMSLSLPSFNLGIAFTLIYVVAIAALGLYWYGLASEESALNADVDRLNRELASLNTTLGQGAGVKAQLAEVKRRVAILEELTKGQGRSIVLLDAFIDTWFLSVNYGFAFVATAIAGALVLIWGLDRADGSASLLIAALMLWAAYGLLRESGRVFMEAAPKGLDPEAIGEALVEEDGVVEVHDLHVWEVTTGMPAISAHMIVRKDADCHEARWRAARLLADRFGVEHSTLQVEHEPGDELLQIDPH